LKMVKGIDQNCTTFLIRISKRTVPRRNVQLEPPNIVILVLYIIVKSVSTIIIENYQNSIKKQKFEKLQKNT